MSAVTEALVAVLKTPLAERAYLLDWEEALAYESYYRRLLWVGMPPKLAATYVGGDWEPAEVAE